MVGLTYSVDSFALSNPHGGTTRRRSTPGTALDGARSRTMQFCLTNITAARSRLPASDSSGLHYTVANLTPKHGKATCGSSTLSRALWLLIPRHPMSERMLKALPERIAFIRITECPQALDVYVGAPPLATRCQPLSRNGMARHYLAWRHLPRKSCDQKLIHAVLTRVYR